MFVQLQNEFIDFKARQAKGVVWPTAVGEGSGQRGGSRFFMLCTRHACASVCGRLDECRVKRGRAVAGAERKLKKLPHCQAAPHTIFSMRFSINKSEKPALLFKG